jgi:excisionase family DNA binding protein
MTAKQAASALGVSPSLVYALCAAGKIAHERHGLGRGRVVIREEALEAYRQKCVKEGRALPAPLELKHIRAG